MAAARIASMALRLLFLIQLVLGIIFWITNNDGIVPFHTIIGILFILSVWTYTAIVGLQTGNVGLVVGGFVLGLLLAIVGLTQSNILVTGPHWIIQVIHLLLAFLTIGFVEGVGGRSRRQATAAA